MNSLNSCEQSPRIRMLTLSGRFAVLSLFAAALAVPAAGMADPAPLVAVTKQWVTDWQIPTTGAATADLFRLVATIPWDGQPSIFVWKRAGTDCFDQGPIGVGPVRIAASRIICDEARTVFAKKYLVPLGSFQDPDGVVTRITANVEDLTIDLMFTPGGFWDEYGLGYEIICRNGLPVGGVGFAAHPLSVSGTVLGSELGEHVRGVKAFFPMVCVLWNSSGDQSPTVARNLLTSREGHRS